MSNLSSIDREQLAKAFKALSAPNRLAMYLDLLAQEETSVAHCRLGDLIDRLEIGAPTVSHHLKELVNAGLIEVQRDGKFIRCRLNVAMRERLAAFFGTTNGPT